MTSANVVINDPKEVDRKIAQLRIDQLHIITDFDKTLTKASYDGRQHQSSIALVRDGGYLSQEYVTQSKALFAKYHPIEVDESIAVVERAKAMEQWWARHWDLMIRSGMSKRVIDDIVEKNVLRGREGLEPLMRLLNEHQVPVLVFSAGIGNIIEGFLDYNKIGYDNVRVFANMFIFDEFGTAIGHSAPMIHTFNKGEAQLPREYLPNRSQVLLLGDSIGDLAMSDHKRHDVELTVGFANKPHQVQAFREAFDVVVTGDGSLQYVSDVISSLAKR